MQLRELGSEGLTVTEIGLGCWQLGGGWGNDWNNDVAQEILAASVEAGVRFIDTADVYGDGASERSIGQFINEHTGLTVATKLGRTMFPDGYSRASLRKATTDSIERLGVSQLDLTQLHCIPPAVLRDGEVFEWLRDMRSEGLIKRFGASVESVEEGLVCLEQDGLTSLQVIFNIFRQKPLERLFPQALAKGVGIIVRLPLASGLLSGKITSSTVFNEADHRNFNRDGAHFNVGETFAGLELPIGIALSQEVAKHVPASMTMAQMALRWVLDHEAVSVVIPGASSVAQAKANAAVAELPPLPAELHSALASLYKEQVHAKVRGPY